MLLCRVTSRFKCAVIYAQASKYGMWPLDRPCITARMHLSL